ncbi:monoamine oxidase [Pseudoalteromonas citrea]|uniref:Tryptophan 2-monooxygenase n=2 Tax=Pseudoalteromonas citrea TaxID=43655 RepID=A0AAD4FRH5_9GAMM|nr:FAD-dependent oxidoreductase [Pseudoalteromonas citrea]KAF7769882.1 monoamine oxidase [Pseudoalteromonas citrea]
MNKNRRQFIKQVSTATLASAFSGQVLADDTLDPFNLQEWRDNQINRPEKHHDILILGAGVSGLCVAYELTKLGVNFQMLEARSKPGGRNETLRHGSEIEEFDRTSYCEFETDKHLYFNVGPARISHHHERVLRYCKELSIPLEPLINDNRNTYFSIDGAFNNTPIKSKELYTSQRGLIASTLAQAIEQNLVSHLLPAQHNDHMLKMLTSFGDLDSNYQFSGSIRAGAEANSGVFTPPQAQPSKDFTQVLPHLDKWARRIHFEQSKDQQSAMLQPVGGMDRIVKGFARNIPKKIRYNSEVLSMKRVKSGSEVTFRNKHGVIKKMTAVQVIVTLPLTVLQDINHDFSAPIAQEVQNANYASAGKTAFQSERFWETHEHIFGGISWLGSDNTQLWYPSSGFGRESGVLVGGYIFDGSAGERFANLSNQERVDSALIQMQHVHPEATKYAHSACSRSWKNTPFSKGGWSSNPPIVEFSHQDGPYIFAGDHTTYLSGWQEGAIASAHRALELLNLD